MKISIGSIKDPATKDVKEYVLFWGDDHGLVNRTGGIDSPYTIAVFPVHHGPDHDQQHERALLLKAILEQHAELTPELSGQLLSRTRSAFEADKLKRLTGTSQAERPNEHAL